MQIPNRSLLALFLLILLVLSLSGCQADQPPEAPTTAHTSTEAPLPTTTFTPAVSPLPTATATPALGIGSTVIRQSDGMTMMYVPAGSFTMGMELEPNLAFVRALFGPISSQNLPGYQAAAPAHSVFLDAYWIDQTEVTNGMYTMCVEAGACNPPQFPYSETRDEYYTNPDYADYPVIFVSRNDGEAYCEWAGARLPTEAEWEKAARGEDERIFPWGDEIVTCDLANVWIYDPDNVPDKVYCVGDTAAVGSYPEGASPYGVLDMAGNVSEWVADWFDAGYYADSPDNNPAGPETGSFYTMVGGEWTTEYGEFAIPRGGSWGTFQHDTRSFSRAAWATWWGVYSFQGFRCAQSLP